MKTRIILLALLIMSMLQTTAMAETKEEKKQRKEREKIEKAREDSIDYAKAVQALKENEFTLIADRLECRGYVSHVNDNVNFMSTGDGRGMVQIAPFMSGFDGINLRGSVRFSEVEIKKKGDVMATADIFGTYINARAIINLSHGGNTAYVTITSNLYRWRISMYGKLFPTRVFPELMSELKNDR